jgi:hypothetical protein
MPDAKGAPLGKLVDLVRRSPGKAPTLGAQVDIKVGPNGEVYIAPDDHTGRDDSWGLDGMEDFGESVHSIMRMGGNCSNRCFTQASE